MSAERASEGVRRLAGGASAEPRDCISCARASSLREGEFRYRRDNRSSSHEAVARSQSMISPDPPLHNPPAGCDRLLRPWKTFGGCVSALAKLAGLEDSPTPVRRHQNRR